MAFQRGPIQTYEVIWKSGHVEQIQAHQVTAPPLDGFAGLFETTKTRSVRRWMFHAEIDGRWGLVLAALDDDIISIRRINAGQSIPDEEK